MKWQIKNQKLNIKIKNPKEIIKTLLENRGLKTKKEQEEFLKPSLKLLEKDFFDKKQVKKALDRIKKAAAKKEKIIVYTDYDADGITAGAIMWEVLFKNKANVLPFVPDRIEDGYGLSQKGIDKILKQNPETKVIITVDHGITAFDAVEYANKKGIDVIITDHHTLPKKLPKAFVIIHTTELAGSGVSFVFSQKIKNAFGDERKNDHISLAAIGTIADLVPLVGANRVIAKYGLEVLQKTKRPGLICLIEKAGLKDKKLTTYDVSHVLAPRINATGRITHALDALRLLCTRDRKKAKDLAGVLNSVNLDRQEMMMQSSKHAKAVFKKDIPSLLFVSDKSYHEGVIGLVAGKLVEEYYRPAIVIARREKYSKASARSVSGLNIIEIIRRASDILVDCGGHPMAAGFTIETEKIELLKNRLVKEIKKETTEEMLTKKLKIDMEINFSDITWDLYRKIQILEPFGVGNPEPAFASRDVNIVDARIVGRENQHLKLKLSQKGQSLKGLSFREGIGFGMGELYTQLSPDKPVDIAFSLSANFWNGEERLEVKVRDVKINN